MGGELHEQQIRVGKSCVTVRVNAPPGTQVNVSVAAEPATAWAAGAPVFTPARAQFQRPTLAWAGLLARVHVHVSSQTVLLILALAVYLTTRLVRLPDFPIFFFTDEAVQTILAQDLVKDELRGYDHQYFPTFFENGNQYNLGVSVYVQVLPYLLFGKSVWVTRGVSVLITLLAALAVGLTLRDVFHSPYPWAATLLLSVTPAWFLHSRTAFETALATSFFAAFLYAYLMYRTASPRYLAAAVILGALTFYTYSPARMVICAAGGLLFLSDLPYHWKHRRVVLLNAILLLVLALPLVRFQATHPDEFGNHLRQLHSYWVEPISTLEKVGRYFKEYTRGLDLSYWYVPNTTDLPRHLMKNYAHLLPASLPFCLGGLLLAVVKIRSAPHRALLLAVLAAPSGAALAALGITRALSMVIPAALLTALGLTFGMEWLRQRWKLPALAVALPVFTILAGFNGWMLSDALVHGPLWFNDYGLGGLQYGANQVFRAIDGFAAENPGIKIILSPSWANGTDVVARFYYPDDHPGPFELGSIEGYLDHKQPLDENTTFVMIPEEYGKVLKSAKFTDIHLLQVVPYPNGQPGFYFVRLRYADNIDQIFEEERQARRVLREAEVLVNGSPAHVRYSYLDIGEIKNAFDGDPYSLLRTLEANPFEVQVLFPAPRRLQGVDVKVGGVATQVAVQVYDAQGNGLVNEVRALKEDANPRTVTIQWDPVQAARVDVTVLNMNDREPAHVHVWEMIFKEK